MSQFQLTQGAVRDLFNGKAVGQDFKPVLQVLNISGINSTQNQTTNSKERYRAVVSDGVNYFQTILGGQLQTKLQNQSLKKFCVFKLEEGMTNFMKSKRICILLNLTVLDCPTAQIGNPTSIDTDSAKLVDGAAPAASSSSTTRQAAPVAQPPRAAPQRATPQPAPQRAPPAPAGRGAAPPGRGSIPPAPRGAAPTPVGRGAPAGRGAQASSSAQPKQPIHQAFPKGGARGKKSEAGAISVDLSQAEPQPISTLNPYQNNWVIKARVMAKSDIKHWNKGDKQGKLMSVDLADADGEIRATMFNHNVEKFHDILQVGGVYFISKGHLKYANKQFSNLKSDFEINVDDHTIIQRAADEDNSIPAFNVDVVRLQDLYDIQDGSVINVAAVVQSVDDAKTINGKDGKTNVKRTLVLADNVDGNTTAVELTMWGKQAEKCTLQPNDVLIFKGVKKSVFGGVSLNASASTQLLKDFDTAEIQYLKQWAESRDPNETTTSLTQKGSGSGNYSGKQAKPRSTLADLKDLVIPGETSYAPVRGVISFVKSENGALYYEGCGNQTEREGKVTKCGKKLTKNEDGNYYCQKCDQIVSQPEYKYMISLTAIDHTGCRWMTAFGQTGDSIFNTDAETMASYLADQKENYEAKAADANFQDFIMNVRIAEQQSTGGFTQGGDSGEAKLRLTLTNVYPFDYVNESKRILRDLEQYDKMA